MSHPGRRIAIGLLLLALVVAACTEATPAETTTTTRVPFVTTPLLAGADDPLQALGAFLDEANQGDVLGAIGLFTDDAEWTVEGFDFAFLEPLDDPLGTITQQYELRALGATGRDLAVGILEVWVTLGTRHAASACTTNGLRARCVYEATDVRSALGGFDRTGTIIVDLVPPFIGRLQISIGETEPPSDEYFDFLRWASVESPEGIGQPSRVSAARDLVPLLDEWIEGGGEVLPIPGPLDDPLAVVRDFVDAWNRRDWPAIVAALDGDAVNSRVATWDAVQGADLLERTFSVRGCTVTIENEAVGAIVICELLPSDVLLTSAGITPRADRSSTFRIEHGRITALPDAVPYPDLVNFRVRGWGEDTFPRQWARDCRGVFVDHSGVTPLACAFLITDALEEVVAEVAS